MIGGSTPVFACFLYYLILTSRGYKHKVYPMHSGKPNGQSTVKDELEAALSQSSHHEINEEAPIKHVPASEIKYNNNKNIIFDYNNKHRQIKLEDHESQYSVIGLDTTKNKPAEVEYYEPKELPRVNIKKSTSDTIIDTVHRHHHKPMRNELYVNLPPVIDISNGQIKNYNKSLWNVKNNVYVSVHKAEHRLAADKLSRNIRVLCWLFDSLDQHLQNAAYVKESWGMRCNVLLFMTNHSSAFPPIIKLRYNKFNNLTHGSMKEALKYVYEHHRNEADWFIMADYTTFLVLENIRYMLSEHRSTDSIMLFFRILSRGGLDSFIWHAEKNIFGCAYDDQGTDILSCLENIGVKTRNTIDAHGCSRYFGLEFFSLKSLIKSIRDRIEKDSTELKKCKSEYAVAFDIHLAKDLREINYLIYHLRPYGITRRRSLSAIEYPLHDGNAIFVSRWLRFFSKAVTPSSVAKQSPQLHPKGSTALALAKEVRILCWVLTYPKNHENRAANIKATWGKRCNILLFMSTQKDPSLPTVVLPVKEGRDYLWAKTKAAFKYIHEHHRNDADWFLKADDDTFVIVENLRYMLSKFSSTEPFFTGCWFKPFGPLGYMSGGAGYVLSRSALDKFINIALPSSSLCSNVSTGAEDINMGQCLANVGVKFLDSRDSLGRARFLPFNPSDHISDGIMIYNSIPWYWDYIKFNTSKGLKCCSEFAITFHYVTPAEMHEFNYLLYKFRLFGVSYDDKIPQNMNINEPRKYEMVKPPPLFDFLRIIFEYFK